MPQIAGGGHRFEQIFLHLCIVTSLPLVYVSCDVSCDAVRMLGQLHRMDAGELAAQWVAYSHNKNGCDVLLETLEAFEREV